MAGDLNPLTSGVAFLVYEAQLAELCRLAGEELVEHGCAHGVIVRRQDTYSTPSLSSPLESGYNASKTTARAAL
jgi:hypothetical protein